MGRRASVRAYPSEARAKLYGVNRRMIHRKETQNNIFSPGVEFLSRIRSIMVNFYNLFIINNLKRKEPLHFLSHQFLGENGILTSNKHRKWDI